MEPLLNSGICRCCASEGNFKDFLSSYHWMGEEEIYADMLKDCFSITLTTSDEVSNGGICEVCITQLRNACNFKRQVQQTEEQFKRQLEDMLLKSNPIKIELARDGDLSDTNLSEDFSANDYEVPIKVEKSEDKPKKRQAKASTSRAKKAKTTDGEPSTKRSRQQIVVVSGGKAQKILQNLQKTNNNKFKKKQGKTKLSIDDDKRMQEVEKHRNNMLEILLHSNATPIRCKGDVGYGCSFCSDQYPKPADLKSHTIKAHDEDNIKKVIADMRIYTVKLDITALQCALCLTDIRTIEELIDHLIKDHERIIYKDIKNHMVPFRFDDDLLKCAICSERFVKFRNLTEHMNTHYRNYVCDVCGAGFVNRDILRSHLRIHKIGEFACDLCPKTFNTLVKKQSHIKIVHKRLYMTRRCGYCNELFDDYNKKNEHLAKYHDVNRVILKCELCDKTFVNQNHYRRHVRKDHLMERNYECEVCDMKFFSSENLRKHVLKHTGERDFQCNLCAKSFARKFTLQQHMRVHSKERRKTCRTSPDRYLIISESDDVGDIN